jgi:hypothetical protein
MTDIPMRRFTTLSLLMRNSVYLCFCLCLSLCLSLTAETVNSQEILPSFLLERLSRNTENWQDSLVCSYKQSRYRTWVRTFANQTETGNSDVFNNPKSQTFGLSLGFEQQWGRQFLSGISAGKSWFTLKSQNRQPNNKENIGGYFASVYFRKFFQRCYFDAETGLGSSENAALIQYADNDDSLFWFVNGEFGFRSDYGLANLEPYLSARYVKLDNDYNDEGKTSFLAGVRYSWKTKGLYAAISPRLFAGVLYESGNRELVHNAFFSEIPVVNYLPGIKIPDARAFFGGGWTSSYGNALDLYFRYTAELASSYSGHTVLLGMRWNF